MLNYGIFMTNTEFREFITRCKETWPEDKDIQEIENQLKTKKNRPFDLLIGKNMILYK